MRGRAQAESFSLHNLAHIKKVIVLFTSMQLLFITFNYAHYTTILGVSAWLFFDSLSLFWWVSFSYPADIRALHTLLYWHNYSSVLLLYVNSKLCISVRSVSLIVRTYILGGRYISAEAFKDLTPEIKHCKIGGTASEQWVAVSVMTAGNPKLNTTNYIMHS